MGVRLWLGVVSAVAVSTAATAQVMGIVTNRSVAYKTIGPFGAYPNPVSKTNSAFELGAGDSSEKAENYQVSANVGADEIDFADNTTTQGYIAETIASTSVDVTYTNGGAKTLSPTLQSTILPGGFGFYMADVAKNPTLTGVTAIGDVNQSPENTSATFGGYEAYGSPGPQVLASFSFKQLAGFLQLGSVMQH